MNVAISASALFAAAFLVHWVVWRVRLPRRQTAALLLILLGSLPVGLVMLWWWGQSGTIPPLGVWGLVHVAIFHVAVSLAYIVAYSAIEERSPSMTMLVLVADAGDAGVDPAELREATKGAVTVEGRLLNMERDRMVERLAGDQYVLLPKGRAWAGVCSGWRKFIRLERGG